jgi:hypothetical protein
MNGEARPSDSADRPPERSEAERRFGQIYTNGWLEFFEDSEFADCQAQFEELKLTTCDAVHEPWVQDDAELTRRWAAAITQVAIMNETLDRRERLTDSELLQLAILTVYQTTVLEGAWEEEGISFPAVDLGDVVFDIAAEGDVEAGNVIDLRAL